VTTAASSDNLTVRAGKWTEKEKEQLKQVVEELSAQQGKFVGCGGFWSEVSEAMEGKRSKKQCYKKWFVVQSAFSRRHIYFSRQGGFIEQNHRE
jgi:hypothetical protein